MMIRDIGLRFGATLYKKIVIHRPTSIENQCAIRHLCIKAR